ncbi:GGDEF domain-containing protein [Alteromonas sp. KUL17]|uniref:GGDEF domain-containing protein n=1 Tax=Alteromonas sp. KUL17 TaxID=2480796 RepID=UPI001F5F19EF|nr:GGDEF domain-containing protein [Alteromonas sp. KUL17]
MNDKYGHVVGDEVLTTFTQIIKNRIRKSDKLCRYGGEEFLIYFSDSDQRSAKRILDELNFTLSRQKHWRNTKEMFSVSFSSGLLDVNGETNLDTIIKMCDELLYRAKREGRARVASFPI